MGTAVQRDRLVESLLDVIEDLRRRVRALETSHPGRPGTGVGNVAYFNGQGMIDASVVGVMVPTSTANVSNPPTAGELATEFGATTEGDGIRGVIDDNSGGTLWAVCVVNGKWGVVELTLRA